MLFPDTQPARPAGFGAQVGLLLAQIEAMQAELDVLRDDACARSIRAEQVERELKLAGCLQRNMLPRSLPNHARVRLNRLYRAADQVSGDLYDIRRLDEQHVGVFVADAIGHGMPAALLAMFMHNVLQTKRIKGDGSYQLLPSQDSMRLLNEALCGQELESMAFATAVYARVNVHNGVVDFARGGHPLPMLIRDGGDVEEIGGEGALLGVLAEETFEPFSVTLGPGDRLIFFSNGVERLFSRPRGPADMDSWREAIQNRRDLRADELLTNLWQHLESIGTLHDDVTLVTLEIPPILIDR